MRLKPPPSLRGDASSSCAVRRPSFPLSPSVAKGVGGLIFHVGFADVLQSGDEIIQYLGRHHDAIPVVAHFLRYTHHASPCIAFQVNKEGLAVCYDFLCANDIVIHGSCTEQG